MGNVVGKISEDEKYFEFQTLENENTAREKVISETTVDILTSWEDFKEFLDEYGIDNEDRSLRERLKFARGSNYPMWRITEITYHKSRDKNLFNYLRYFGYTMVEFEKLAEAAGLKYAFVILETSNRDEMELLSKRRGFKALMGNGTYTVFLKDFQA
jgi:hypothetical protein